MTKGRGAVAVFSVLLTIVLLGMPVTGGAQGSPEGRTYGTASQVAHAVQASGLTGDSSTDNTYLQTHGESRARYCTQGTACWLNAPVRLPAGAMVTRLDLYACLDGRSQFDFVAVDFMRLANNEQQPPAHLASVLSNSFDVVYPACTNFPVALETPETINNDDYWYLLQVVIFASGVGNRFHGVRLFYTLQVSPAPAVATFGDVPVGHPQHRYIEALVNSGITAGCGGGNYCPDAPLTRGQMAVFLSKGLGLHFAP